MRSSQVAYRIDPLEEIRKKFKTDRKLKKLRTRSIKSMGSFRLFKCEVCKVLVCSSNYPNGKKFCECGKEMNRVLAPNFRLF